jgi:hypothetical protein
VTPGSFGTSCLKFFCSVAGHDQQVAVWQLLRECDEAVLSPEQEEAIRTGSDQDYGSDHGPHLRLGVRMERDAVISVQIAIAKHGVVIDGY